MLHDEKNLFEQLILRTSDAFEIERGIVEKDYYVTVFLKAIAQKEPDIVFKGGTSLSKCYHIINRFSEDIDLNIEMVSKPTQGQRECLKKNIVAVTQSFGFTVQNPDEIKSRRDFNRYLIDYQSTFDTGYLKRNLIVETAVFFRTYPTRKMNATSLIYDYLNREGMDSLIAQYDLFPFEVNVQAAERTFVDKLCAIGDYYLSGTISEHSRHIYDIYKLIDLVPQTKEFKALVEEVRNVRAMTNICPSAQPEVNVPDMLNFLIRNEIYKDDYENVTSRILEEKVSYEVAIEAVKKIAMSGMFERQSSEEENNTRYLEKKLADYKAGKLKVEEHELIEE